MELSFANGVQEYTVHGVKGDVIIRFNPTDGAFIQRLYNASLSFSLRFSDAASSVSAFCFIGL